MSFEWFEGTTLIATGETVSATLPPGTHIITLKMTDSGGISDTDEVVVTVQDTTAPTLSVSVSVFLAGIRCGILQAMDTKGNGLDRTNELLGQVVQELLAIKNQLGTMDLRLMRVETGIAQLNTNMSHLATLVGQELKDIKKRLDVLERKAA